jgi:hypothetical protein
MSKYRIRMGEIRNSFRILVAKIKERGHLEDLDVDGKILLKWILRK